ncbi:MAG: flagellar filament capping protein FliD [Pirellulaceae bacterium]
MFSIDGLISGLDTETIINGLVQLQKNQVDRLTFRKSEIQIQQQAMQGVETRLFSLRAQMVDLNRSSNGVFSARFAKSSQEDIVSATANNNAAVGTYNIRVTSRAAAQQLGSSQFNNSAQEITTGTFSIQVGDRPVTAITIDGSNNSIAGLVQAINTQSPDVSAAIIRDSANGTERILLTSKHSGAANQITIDNQLGAPSGNAIRPDFSGTPIQEGTNAVIQIGSGPGAITAEFESNQVDGLIEGVVLDLLSVDANQDVAITVSRDLEAVKTDIQEFVDGYNSLIDFIAEQSKFDTATQTAGPLLGNRSVANLQNQMSEMITDILPGSGAGLNRFSQIGISIDGKGSLSVDSVRLDKALKGELSNVSVDELPRLFGMTGKSTITGIDFLLGSTKTKSNGVPYQVDIIQAAERGTVTGTTLGADPIVIDALNKGFEISVDGVKSEVLTLSEGSYTSAQLATHLQSIINSSQELGNRKVTVAVDGGQLKITSDSYGSSSKVSAFAGSSLSTLGLSGNPTGVGKDVAGTFIVNGVVETATGTGRILIGNQNNENTADLQVRVTLTPSQVHGVVEGEVTVSRGITSRLDQMLGDFLDSSKGAMATINRRFDSQIESIDQSITRVNNISDAKRESLVKQFAALERALSSLHTTQSIVASQLAGIQNN